MSTTQLEPERSATAPVTPPRRRFGFTTFTRWAAVAYVALLGFLVLFAGFVMPYDPVAQDIGNRLAPPLSPGHLLGTDAFGRDILSRLIDGAQIEILVAVATTIIAVVLGSTLGMLGAYFGSWVETLTMRVVIDVLLAFPPVVLALLAVSIYGPGPVTLTVVMGVLFAPTFARILYGQVLSVKSEEYVEAAQVFGASKWEILTRVVFPNASAPTIAQLSLTVADAILLESGLSYLGLGVVPPKASWGSMVAEGQRYLNQDVWLLLIPSLTLVVTILAFSILGNWLRDKLDPRTETAS